MSYIEVDRVELANLLHSLPTKRGMYRQNRIRLIDFYKSCSSSKHVVVRCTKQTLISEKIYRTQVSIDVIKYNLFVTSKLLDKLESLRFSQLLLLSMVYLRYSVIKNKCHLKVRYYTRDYDILYGIIYWYPKRPNHLVAPIIHHGMIFTLTRFKDMPETL